MTGGDFRVKFTVEGPEKTYETQHGPRETRERRLDLDVLLPVHMVDKLIVVVLSELAEGNVEAP